MTKNSNQTVAPERETAPNLGIYHNFVASMADRADDEVMELADKLASERDPDAILAMQKTLRSTRRKAKILAQLMDSIYPEDLLELIDAVAEPGVKQEFQPMFDMIQDLITSLDLTRGDIRTMQNPFRGVRHE